ncbi:MAG: MBL fold metallo-hydrolase [Candidatus Bathyarchaeota archaeon]|nr:MAG: MBL fold metallo-hydrolase [Candidatus Bathyarchaeota archaeon]
MGKKTALTFYGGVNEIGGNKILLEDGEVRIFLDFGQSFSMGADYFTGWLAPRAINGLGDYFEFNLLPKMKGVYSKEQLTERFKHLFCARPEINAVFLSHAHIDHIGQIMFLSEKIPIHCGYGTKIFLESMEETSPVDFGNHPYERFRTGHEIGVAQLVVEPIHVDHSIPASYGFIIHTSEGAIVYTGDLRAHGPRKEMTEEFVEEACGADPVAMITEGTRMGETRRRRNYSESKVKELGDQIVSSTDKIVFATHYGRDTDRFRTFYEIAKDNGRKLVISPKTAHLLSRLVEDKHLRLPDPMKDEDIRVYYKRKRTGSFQEKDYYIWEREFMDKMVTHEFVHEHQGEIVMDLDFYQFAELVDIKPDPGSHFIHSMSEPFSEEDIEDEVMHNWLNHFKIVFHQLHASGHLNREQIIDVINRVKPRKIFPIHTESPQQFKATSDRVHQVNYGRKCII